MITPRRTRLVRVADLHEFRHTLTVLSRPEGGGSRRPVVIVPTRAAGRVLSAAIAVRGCSMWGPASDGPLCLTRDQFYERLHARFSDVPRRLTAYERDAIAQAAATAAAATLEDLPFRIRPGLVGEVLGFYDYLRRQSQQIQRFETLVADAFGGNDDDRGAARLLGQTRFLARTFRDYEQRLQQSGAIDEHGLRAALLTLPSERMVRHVIVTVADWIADPNGLFIADFDFLARVPGLESLDIVCTEGLLASGFHERLHNWWPGLDEIDTAKVGSVTRVRPMLRRPASEDDRLWFTHRDREDELAAVAARLTNADREQLSRTAVVFKRPLPYLYLAPLTLGDAGIAYRVYDELPLAAEPVAATLDLILDALETDFSREALVALLRSPHFTFTGPDGPVTRESIAALNRALSGNRYLGGAARFEQLTPKLQKDEPEAAAGLAVARELIPALAPFLEPRPASAQLTALRAFLDARLRPIAEDDPFGPREQRGRAVILDIIGQLADAHRTHHDPEWGVEELAGAVRRAVGDYTFPEEPAGQDGVHFVDDQAARYGDFEDITIVGLIDNEWPDRPRRNIFYSPALLKAVGWPSEQERRAAEDARFLDLLASASGHVELSTFSLDEESIVTRSVQLDEVPLAKLSAISTEPGTRHLEPGTRNAEPGTRHLEPGTASWQALRDSRPPIDDPRFHGAVGERPSRPWSVSALETYIGCPFKFYAQHVLRLEEEPDDEEVMDPRRQGQLVHQVFEQFFKAWQADGHGAITAATLDLARERFAAVVEEELRSLPDGEAGLERTRLLGSSAAAGLGEAVFRMEAERAVPVVERLLEHRLDGRWSIATEQGARTVTLKGKADRLDLLADGTFRLIDYKLGWPPDRTKALQLPIYGLCAEQQLAQRSQRFTLGEAVYLAFKGPKRVVPLFTSPAQRDEVLAKAQQRLADTIDAIERGDFPPTPDDVYRCETCSFAAVCRKDYVGDV